MLPRARVPSLSSFGSAAAAMAGCFSLIASVTTAPGVTFAQAGSHDLPVPELKIPLLQLPAWRVDVYQTGLASTYGEGDRFEGNVTACGRVFHTSVVQVAHKTLPCGTVVRIEDAATGRSVTAEVTDRGPYIPGRIVDLSWGAFRQLDPSAPGLLEVNVYLFDN